MSFENDRLLLPISILKTLVNNCDIELIAKYNRLFVYHAGVVGLGKARGFKLEPEEIFETLYVNGYIELVKGAPLEKDSTGILKPTFKLCEFSYVKNDYFTSNIDHELFLSKDFSETSLLESYHCEIEEFVKWLQSVGLDVSPKGFGFILFIGEILNHWPEYSFRNSKPSEMLVKIFLGLWGEESVKVLYKEIEKEESRRNNYPSENLKSHKYMSSVTAEEAALIAGDALEFSSVYQYYDEFERWLNEDGKIKSSRQLASGEIVEKPLCIEFQRRTLIDTIHGDLCEEVYLARRWKDYGGKISKQDYFEKYESNKPPERETLIVVVDDDNNEEIQRPNISKESLVLWFDEKEDFDLARKFIQDFYPNCLLNAGHESSNFKKEAYSTAPIPEENMTTWLKILFSAVNEHFSAHRKRDPKRDTVVEWILEQAKKEGINPSDNIAKAIFTIIKPEDHNPKKKKG